MRYLKKFENIKSRMPRKCSLDEITQKAQIHNKEKWNDDERAFFKKYVFNHEIGENSLCIRNLFISKRQDNWFTILELGSTSNLDAFYIADEFIEVQNFVKSYALPI